MLSRLMRSTRHLLIWNWWFFNNFRLSDVSTWMLTCWHFNLNVNLYKNCIFGIEHTFFGEKNTFYAIWHKISFLKWALMIFISCWYLIYYSPTVIASVNFTSKGAVGRDEIATGQLRSSRLEPGYVSYKTISELARTFVWWVVWILWTSVRRSKFPPCGFTSSFPMAADCPVNPSVGPSVNVSVNVSVTVSVNISLIEAEFQKRETILSE